MAKINFTQEHLEKLKALFLELGFTGEVLSGKFGANSYTVWECIHGLSISTLKSINASLKKEIAVLSEEDEWIENKGQDKKVAKLKKWQKFVSLCIGYKLHLQQMAEEAALLRLAKAERLATLKGIKAEAELAELKKLSSEELQRMIDAEIADGFPNASRDLIPTE